MLLTPPQLKRFWSKQDGWPVIVKAHGWDAINGELQRKALLRRAGFDSLTQVDRLEGFTAVLKEMAILQDNLAGMLHADANPQRVLIHTINELAARLGQPYADKICRNRFGHTRLEDLCLDDLANHRSTLTARLASRRRAAKAALQTDLVADPF